MKSKITEGEWTYDGQRIVGPLRRHPQDHALGSPGIQTRSVIAYVRGYTGKAEQDANGSLLAAAPKLLELLEWASGVLEEIEDAANDNVNEWADFRSVPKAEAIGFCERTMKRTRTVRAKIFAALQRIEQENEIANDLN